MIDWRQALGKDDSKDDVLLSTSDYLVLQMIGATWLVVCLYSIAWQHREGCETCDDYPMNPEESGQYWCKEGRELLDRAREAQDGAIRLLALSGY